MSLSGCRDPREARRQSPVTRSDRPDVPATPARPIERGQTMIAIEKTASGQWLLLWSHKDWPEYQVPFLRATLGPHPQWPWADAVRITAPLALEGGEIWLPVRDFFLLTWEGNLDLFGERELRSILRNVLLPLELPTIIRGEFDEWKWCR